MILKCPISPNTKIGLLGLKCPKFVEGTRKVIKLLAKPDQKYDFKLSTVWSQNYKKLCYSCI